MKKLISKSKIFLALTLVIAMLVGGAQPAFAASSEKKVSMKTIETHDTYDNLNSKEQKRAYKAITKKLKSGKYEADEKGLVKVYAGWLSDKDVKELSGIISDEYFPAYGELNISTPENIVVAENDGVSVSVRGSSNGRNDDGSIDLKIKASAFDDFNKNVKYIKTIQEKAKSLCNKKMTEKQASDAISKWIRNRTSYKDCENSGEAWWVYQNKKARCEGYAQLYKIMCNGVGIDCNVVVGYGHGEPHMWNRVKIDGKWYYADVTWYDTGSKNKKYAYASKLWSNHEIDRNLYR